MKRMDWKWEYENLCKFATDYERQRDDLSTRLTSARESLAMALRALENINHYTEDPKTEDRFKIKIANQESFAAIAEITKRGDYIPEGKG